MLAELFGQFIRMEASQFMAGMNVQLTSRTGNFWAGDVGLHVDLDDGTHTLSTRIKQLVSPTVVYLADAFAVTSTRCKFSIHNRQDGTIDRMMTLFPNQFITMAIGTDGNTIDIPAATRDTDPNNQPSDTVNYAARVMCNRARARYPGRMIAQVNSFTANSRTYQNAHNKTDQYSHLADIRAAGGLVAGQFLWFVHGDSTFRMNGGDNIDKDNPPNTLTELQIAEKAASKVATYGGLYPETYMGDMVALLGLSKFEHDLFTDGGAADLLPPIENEPPQRSSRCGLSAATTGTISNFKSRIS